MCNSPTVLLTIACLGCSPQKVTLRRDPVALLPIRPVAMGTRDSLNVSAPASPASVAPESELAPTADVGRFSARVIVEPTEISACMGAIAGFDVSPSGNAWVVGGCGLRFRVDSEGHVKDFRAPLQTKFFNFGGVRGSCHATAFFTGVFARSEHEVYVVGDTRGGQDPNAIWYRPMETFNGKHWSSTKASFGKGAHEGLPWGLTGNGELLYTLVAGDDWHGPPECAVHRFSNGSWGKAELACPQPEVPDDRVMKLKHLEVTHDGTLWVAGIVLRNGNPTSGMLWTRPSGHTEWTEIALDDKALSSVSVSADGAVYAAGRSVWRFEAGSFARISDDQEDPVNSLWAESGERVWFIRRGKPYVWTRGAEAVVAVDSEDELLRGIHGSGSQVWATSEYQVWQLRRDKDLIPPTTVLLSGPRL